MTEINLYEMIEIVKAKPGGKVKEQLGVRVEPDLKVEVKVLAVRQRRHLGDLIEEALRLLLKKYKSE